MNLKRITSAGLALCMALSLGVSAFAEGENIIDHSGGDATTPITLSTVDAGGKAAPTKMSVTVPTTIPIIMDENGTITVANNVKIINNSYGAVRVKSATINSKNGWKLAPFGAASTLASEKVNSNKLGFQLKLGADGTAHGTNSSDTRNQTLISSAEAGCHMSGALNTATNFVPVTYDAIATPVSEALEAKQIAEMVFVVEWDILSLA